MAVVASWLHAVIRGLSLANRANLEVCRISAILLAAGIAAVVAAGVFWRYVLNDALSWYEELAKFMMLWLVFVGAPIALRLGDHVAIQMLPNALPPRARALLMIVVSLVIAWFCLMLTIQSHAFAWNGRSQVAIAIGDISMYWIFVSIPFGAASMLLVAVQQTLEQIADLIAPGQGPKDGFVVKYEPLLRDLG